MAMVEAEFGSLVELLPVPIVVTTERGYIIRANPAAVGFLDCSQALVGKHINDVLRGLTISVRMRMLVQAERAMRIYVLQSQPDPFGQRLLS